jgi:flavin reductase (DIM6/NTAB) family NADH-FMN oxidoreductase RutF
MAIQSDDFRNALRHFPAGVTIVSIKAGEETHGTTVSAFASVSPNPPLILICIDHRGRGHKLLEHEDAVFAVNILKQDQEDLSNRFAFSDEDRFAEGNWATAETGAPILEDAAAWLDCTIFNRHIAGTHTIYVGEVQACKVIDDNAEPLVYWNRGYRNLDLSSE